MLAEHEKCVPLSGCKSRAGLARCQLNADILRSLDASLTSSVSSVTFGGTTTTEVTGCKLKAPKQLEWLPRRQVCGLPPARKAVAFGLTAQGMKKSSIYGKIIIMGLITLFSLLLREKVEVFFCFFGVFFGFLFPIPLITVMGKDTMCFLTTGVLGEQLPVLQLTAFRPHSSGKLSFTYSVACFHQSLTRP